MSRLFKRVCTIVVDGVKVDGLRVVFRVSKTTEKQPNALDAKIYNLSERTRSAMQKRSVPVVLVAGHEATAAVIFSGDARTIDHVREGAEWVTHAQCGDGERAYQFGRVNESFAPGTPLPEAIRRVAKGLGINVGNLEQQLAQGGFRGNLTQLAHGYVARGKASAELDKLLRTAGLSWSIQDGALQVLRGGVPASNAAVLLSPETGLVGSPDHGTPEQKVGSPTVLKVKSLLNPQIRCGGRVEVRSAGVRGQYLVKSLQHSGDSGGNEWYTSAELTPAP